VLAVVSPARRLSVRAIFPSAILAEVARHGFFSRYPPRATATKVALLLSGSG